MTTLLVLIGLVLGSLAAGTTASSSSSYEPSWESLDSRPLPQWYPDAKIGIFLHWGVFSVPAYGSEWFWQRWKGGTTHDNDPTNEFDAYVNATENAHRFAYQDYAHRFGTWVVLVGIAWVVLVSKSTHRFVDIISHTGRSLFLSWLLVSSQY
jgi:alpha-L-fucosidase